MLRRLSGVVSHDVLRTVYFACMHSRLTYGVLLWGNSAHSMVAFRAQKSAIRTIFQLKTSQSCRGYFRRLGTLTVPALYILSALIFVRENIDCIPKHSDTHSYYTRRCNDLCPPAVRLSKSLTGSPLQVGPRLYNYIPAELREVPDKVFRKKLKSILIDSELYSVSTFCTIEFDKYM